MSEKQVDKNYEKFKELLPELLKSNPGKQALMRHEELVDVFDTLTDAMKYAAKEFGDGEFSIQHITDEIIDLGWYTRAVSNS